MKSWIMSAFRADNPDSQRQVPDLFLIERRLVFHLFQQQRLQCFLPLVHFRYPFSFFIQCTENFAPIPECTTYLSQAKRGYVSKIPLVKIFNYILYQLSTGCQWAQLPIETNAGSAPKKKSAGVRSTTTFASGVMMAALSGCGRGAS